MDTLSQGIALSDIVQVRYRGNLLNTKYLVLAIETVPTLGVSEGELRPLTHPSGLPIQVERIILLNLNTQTKMSIKLYPEWWLEKVTE